MARIRVYLPLSAAQLAQLAQERELPAESRAAFCVTAGLETSAASAGAGTDAESLEHLACQQAADAAHAAGQPVVVAALDVRPADVRGPELLGQPGAAAAATETPAQVVLSGPVRVEAVASFQVGDDAITGERTPAGESGPELSWYDPTELDQIRDLPGIRGR